MQLVSVIIPTYRGADKICRAVDSVLNQTYQNIEIIVVDDNGKNTAEQKQTEGEMQRYAGNSKVKYIAHSVNKNGSAARNTGIAASSGSLLAFLDDDDAFLPEKTAVQVKKFDSLSDDYGLIYGSFKEQISDTASRDIFADSSEDFLYKFLCNETIACSSTVMIRRSVLDKVKGWDETFFRHQDLEFFARIAFEYKVDCVPELCVEKFKLDRNMPKGKKYEEYRLYYLKKMRPIIETFSPKRQKRLYNIHYTEIGKCYIKEKQLGEAMKWAFKTSNPLKTLFVFAKDGVAYVTRKK